MMFGEKARMVTQPALSREPTIHSFLTENRAMKTFETSRAEDKILILINQVKFINIFVNCRVEGIFKMSRTQK